MSPSIARQAQELRMATFRLARRLRAEKADDELSDGQFSVLAYLHADGAHSLGELAEREHVSAPSMNRTVTGLRELGYVSSCANEDDKRKVTLALTEAGTNVVAETVRRRDAWLTRSIGALSAAERATLTEAAELMRGLTTR